MTRPNINFDSVVFPMYINVHVPHFKLINIVKIDK